MVVVLFSLVMEVLVAVVVLVLVIVVVMTIYGIAVTNLYVARNRSTIQTKPQTGLFISLSLNSLLNFLKCGMRSKKAIG